VDASAAQKRPVTKTCLQCGAVLPSSIRVCKFCDSAIEVGFHSQEECSASSGQDSSGLKTGRSNARSAAGVDSDSAWRGELSQRLHAYRVRRRKVAPSLSQSQLPFEEPTSEPAVPASVAVAEAQHAPDEDFAFTIAIGRNAATREEARMEIDVSLPPVVDQSSGQTPRQEERSDHSGLYPVASIDERRIAGLIDAGCLLFAYGGFLALFGSLGGQFTLSKLSGAVCIATFVIEHRDVRYRLLAVFRPVHSFRRNDARNDAARLASCQLLRRNSHPAANALAQCWLHAFRWHFLHGISVGHVG